MQLTPPLVLCLANNKGFPLESTVSVVHITALRGLQEIAASSWAVRESLLPLLQCEATPMGDSPETSPVWGLCTGSSSSQTTPAGPRMRSESLVSKPAPIRASHGVQPSSGLHLLRHELRSSRGCRWVSAPSRTSHVIVIQLKFTLEFHMSSTATQKQQQHPGHLPAPGTSPAVLSKCSQAQYREMISSMAIQQPAKEKKKKTLMSNH